MDCPSEMGGGAVSQPNGRKGTAEERRSGFVIIPQIRGRVGFRFQVLGFSVLVASRAGPPHGTVRERQRPEHGQLVMLAQGWRKIGDVDYAA